MGLTRCSWNPASTAASPISLLTVARHGQQAQRWNAVPSLSGARASAGPARSRPSRAGRCRERDVGRKRRRSTRALSGRRWRSAPRGRGCVSACGQHLGGVLVVVDHEDARGASAAGRRASRGGSPVGARRRAPPPQGSSTTNSLPLPEAVALRAHRAAVQLDQALARWPARDRDHPSSGRRLRCLHEALEDAVEHVRLDADALVADAHDDRVVVALAR